MKKRNVYKENFIWHVDDVTFPQAFDPDPLERQIYNEKSRAKKMLEPLFEQKRILQFNNQNLHNSNIHYILR